MDWVHCNRCYVQPGDSEKKFFITNCGHIYCNECLEQNQSNECKICHIKYITTPLSANMSSEVEVFFHDPLVNFKKQLKILEFQKSHRSRLFNHNKEIAKSYKIMKKESYAIAQELKMCKQENMALKEEIKRMKADFYEFKKQCENKIMANDRVRGSQRTPQMSSFSHFMTKDGHRTPIMMNKNPGDEGNKNLSVKRSATSDFFLMTESIPSEKNKKPFPTPELPKFPGSYRLQKTSTPNLNTPPTPDSILSELSHRDPLQRKVKLPSSRSSTTRIGFQGLTLSRSTSTPFRDSVITNKYSKYFK